MWTSKNLHKHFIYNLMFLLSDRDSISHYTIAHLSSNKGCTFIFIFLLITHSVTRPNLDSKVCMMHNFVLPLFSMAVDAPLIYDHSRTSQPRRDSHQDPHNTLNKLKDTTSIMGNFIPELMSVVPCPYKSDHMNQLGFLSI